MRTKAQERIEAALRHSQRETFLERARKQGNTATTPRRGEGSGREARRAAVAVVKKENPSDEGRSKALGRELTGVASEDSAGPDAQESARDGTTASAGEKVNPEHAGVFANLLLDSGDTSGSTGQYWRTKAAAQDKPERKRAGVRNGSVPIENFFGRLIVTTTPEGDLVTKCFPFRPMTRDEGLPVMKV